MKSHAELAAQFLPSSFFKAVAAADPDPSIRAFKAPKNQVQTLRREIALRTATEEADDHKIAPSAELFFSNPFEFITK